MTLKLDWFRTPEVRYVIKLRDTGELRLADVPVNHLEISVKTCGTLLRGNFKTVGDVEDAADSELLSVPHLGRGRLEEIRRATDCFRSAWQAHYRLAGAQERIEQEHPEMFNSASEAA